MFVRTLAAAGAVALLLVSCAPRRPAPAPAPPPPQQPAPAPPPVAPGPGWEEAPLAAGDWTDAVEGSRAVASFGPPGAAIFILRCEANRSVTLARTRVPGARGNAMTIRTTYGERRLAAVVAHLTDVLATIPASDPLLDEIAFSRGRFAVEADGTPRLILPSWPEPARVVEDCRG